MNSVNGQLAVGLVFVGTTALICYADVLVDARVVLVVFVLVVHLLTPELGNFVASRMGRKGTILPWLPELKVLLRACKLGVLSLLDLAQYTVLFLEFCQQQRRVLALWAGVQVFRYALALILP